MGKKERIAGAKDGQLPSSFEAALRRALDGRLGEATPAPPVSAAATALCSAYNGSVRVDNIAAFGQSNPQQSREESFKKCRYWFRFNLFVRTVLLARLGFYNFGFQVKAVAKGDQKVVAEWYRKNRRALKRYAREAWTEWALLDNVATVWRTSDVGTRAGAPLVYPPEDTDYKDAFGVERLTIQHNLSAEQLRKMGFPPALVKLMTANGNRMELRHDQEDWFAFDVQARERLGQGYAWPGLAVVFETCSAFEGLQVGDALRANLTRNVYEHHRCGHEIKSGPHAGSKAHFLTKGRSETVEKSLKGKVGHIKLVTNFDHEIEYPGQDAGLFEAKRYEGVYRQLEVWGMPVAQMVFTKTLNPHLMDLLKTQAIAEREIMEEHFNKVFNNSGERPPAEVRVSWSNRCFRDSRLAADLLKKALDAGPLSQGTFLEEAGYDAEEERERKAEESKLPKEQVLPLYDAQHALRPGQDTPGRKPGQGDGQGQL